MNRRKMRAKPRAATLKSYVTQEKTTGGLAHPIRVLRALINVTLHTKPSIAKGNDVPNAEISLHETPLPGKEGGDAESYNYAKGKGSSNSALGEEPYHNAGELHDTISQGRNGPAGFRQSYTVEGKPAKIIWRKDVPAATSQKVLIRADRVVIIPEANQ